MNTINEAYCVRVDDMNSCLTNNSYCEVNIYATSSTTPTEYELDATTARILKIATNCVIVNLICIFGIVGNSLNIAVLRQHGFRETTNVLLVSLSTSDLVFSFLVPISRLQCIVDQVDEVLAVSVHTFATLATFMPKYICLASSVSYVVVIAIERFMAVFFPFHVGKYFTRSVMVCLVVAFPTICIVSLIPSFMALEYEWIFDAKYDRTVAVLKYTDFYKANHEIVDYYTWVGLSNFYCTTSTSIVTVCCLAIGFKLTRAKIRRESMTKKATGYDAKVVKMLVTVCVVYLVVIIPTITMYSIFRPDFIITSSVYSLVDDIGVILHSVNASMNFLVYVTMSEKFAATYRRLLTCKAGPKHLGKPKIKFSY